MANSSIKREFVVDVNKEGRISDMARKTIADLIAKVPGRKIKITIALYKKSRSNNQNAFYWGCVVPLIKNMFTEAGNNVTDVQVHLFLKMHVGGLTKKVVLPDGEVISVVDTSTKLTTTEWEIYITKIRAWSSEFDLIIPFPNEEKENYEKVQQM